MSKDRLEEIISNEAYLEDTNDLVMVINTEDYKWLIGQAERLQELRKRYLTLTKENNQVNDELIDVFRENKRYREAMEFYANEENYFFDEKEYKVGLGVPESEITIDYGNKARKALEGEE